MFEIIGLGGSITPPEDFSVRIFPGNPDDRDPCRLGVRGGAPFILDCACSSNEKFLLIILSPVQILPELFHRFAEVLSAEKPRLVYCDFYENGKVRRLFNYPGDLTERFYMGEVLGVRRDVLLELGLNLEFSYAYLYDFRLRLEEAGGEIIHIGEPLYRVKTYEKGNRLLSSFNYLLYPRHIELEYEKVFKDMLMRRGAYISGRPSPVVDDLEHEVPVSVIIPVRNRAKFIGKALGSVLNQTFRNFEVVVVDTGSTDGTRDILLRYANSDPRIRPIFIDGGSLAKALNTCVINARGEFVAQLDSDDEYTPDALEVAVDVMRCHPEAGLGVSYYEVIDEDGNPVEEIGIVRHLEFDRNNILRTEGAGALRIWRRKVLLEMGLFDDRHFPNFGEDYDMVLRVTEKYDLVRIHAVLYRYRKHIGSSDIRTNDEEKLKLKTLARRVALERRKVLNRAKLLARALSYA